jgi:hypothetical protein
MNYRGSKNSRFRVSCTYFHILLLGSTSNIPSLRPSVKFHSMLRGCYSPNLPQEDILSAVRWQLIQDNRSYHLHPGPAVVQGVSHRIHTAMARVRDQVKSCGLCGQRGTGGGFLRVLRFFPAILFTQCSTLITFIIRSCCNRPNSGHRSKWTSLISPQEIRALNTTTLHALKQS